MLRIIEWMNSYDGSILPYVLCYLAACLVLAVPVMYLLDKFKLTNEYEEDEPDEDQEKLKTFASTR